MSFLDSFAIVVNTCSSFFCFLDFFTSWTYGR